MKQALDTRTKLLTKSPWPLMIELSIPAVLGMVVVGLYNMMDSIFVGQMVGDVQMGAISVSYPLTLINAGSAAMLGVGSASVLSRAIGKKDENTIKKIMGNLVAMVLLLSVIYTVVGMVFTRQLLSLTGASDNILNYAEKYLRIIFAGSLFVNFFQSANMVIRGEGQLKKAMTIIASGAILNIILDPIFISILNPYGMGIEAAAYATIFSQGISAVLCLFYIYRSMPDMWPEKHHWKLHAADSRHQLSMGIPMALQFAITASGTMIMQAAINLFGSEAVAAFTAACKLQNLVTQGFSAMGQTMATYSGQNFGKGDIPRIKKGVRAALLTSVTYSIAAAALVFLLLKPCLSLFFSGDVDMAAMMPWAKTYSYMCALFYVPLCTIFIFRNAMQGCGYGFLPMMGGVSELFARLIVAVIAIKVISYPLACFCDPAAWVTAAVFTGVSYLFVMKDIDKKYDSKTPTAPIS